MSRLLLSLTAGAGQPDWSCAAHSHACIARQAPPAVGLGSGQQRLPPPLLRRCEQARPVACAGYAGTSGSRAGSDRAGSDGREDSYRDGSAGRRHGSERSRSAERGDVGAGRQRRRGGTDRGGRRYREEGADAAPRRARPGQSGGNDWADARDEQPVDDLERWMQRLASMPPTSRSVALLQLLRIEQEGAFSGLVGGAPGVARRRGRGAAAAAGDEDVEVAADGVDSAGGRQAAPQLTDPRDRRAVTELVNGTTRWRRRLDFTLGVLCGKPTSQLDAPLAALLRMGLYELAELKSPAHIINEYVELAKQLMHRGAGAVANATLRNVCRGMEAGSLPQPPAPAQGMSPAQAADALALGASHPTWLVQGWLRQYGPADTVALLRHNNLRPRFSLRLPADKSAQGMLLRLEELGVKARPSRFLPEEFVVVEEGMQALLASGLVQRGEAQVQDEAAGLVVALLDPQPGERILDACAAPGGKTLFAAARMRGRGGILAMDAAASRLAALRETARRQGYSGCVRTLASDLRRYARDAAPTAGAPDADGGSEGGSSGPGRAAEARQQGREWARAPFDRVLLDVPCSGTGVLAKRADLRWRRTPEQVEQLLGLQAELLDAGASLVAPGGLLVYSTCSLERAENEDQVAAFLARHGGEFVLEAAPAEARLPAKCLSADGCLTMLPHVHGTDGAFAARLRRTGGSTAVASGGGLDAAPADFE